jgi:3-oxoacyl-[acyl-carrier-protein] synthase II
MQLRRVVITGMGAISPFGKGVDVLMESLIKGLSGTVIVPELKSIEGVRSHVAALVQDVDPGLIPRKYRRTMSRMSVYAVLACQEALIQAGLGPEYCSGGDMGVSIGSTIASIDTFQRFFKDYLSLNNIEQMRSGTFFQLMNHSCASNVAQALGIEGRVIAPSAACSTGCQASGLGYETIAFGKQDFMLCGGSDEFHPLTTASFDLLNAASTGYNDRPHETPRPFDRDRDGIVCAEGSGILLLESLESALQRGATILAEIAGFATTSNPENIADPSASSMEACMKKALADAGLGSEDVDYVNAHATATIQGDVEESLAIYEIFGKDVPVSSLKGHLGHTMAASGALELIATIEMMNRNCVIPTLNLENPDDMCKKINLTQKLENREIRCALKNNFALGGVNSSLVLRRYENDKR